MKALRITVFVLGLFVASLVVSVISYERPAVREIVLPDIVISQ